MKAAIQLTPAESKRLIAKGVVAMPQVKAALANAYVILGGGTTNAFVAQELLGRHVEPARFTAGISSFGLLCVTDAADRVPFPLIFYKGELVEKTIRQALDDFHKDTVMIKGANAIDPQGNVGVITSGFDGGTVAAVIGTITSQGLTYITPVGLEKLIPSVREAVQFTGAKTLDYTMGADYGMYCLSKALAVTEIDALRIMFGVEAHLIAAGGVGGSEGAVSLIVTGEEEPMKQALALLESIKGEPRVKGLRSTCESCRYSCRFAGTPEGELPGWLTDRLFWVD